QAGEIVADVQHAAVFGADILRAFGGEMLSAAGAFEVGNLHRWKDSTLALSTTFGRTLGSRGVHQLRIAGTMAMLRTTSVTTHTHQSLIGREFNDFGGITTGNFRGHDCVLVQN